MNQRGDAAEWRLLVGCSTIFTLGSMVGWLSPQIVYGAIHHFDVSSAQAGLLTLAEGTTLGVLTVLLALWFPVIACRNAALFGLSVFVVANLGSAWAESFAGLVAIRCLAGLGDAVLTYVAIVLIAQRSASPVRSYSLMTVALILVGALLVGGSPQLMPNASGLSYLSLAGGIGLIASPLIGLLPDGVVSRPPVRSTRMDANVRCQFAALLAFMALSCFQAFMLFAFSAGLGDRIGLGEVAMNSVLAIGLLGSLAGPLFIVPVAANVGRWRALVGAGLLLLPVNLIVTLTGSPTIFSPFLVLNMVLLHFIIPLLLATSSELDPTGRLGAVMIGGINLVTTIAPAIAAGFVDSAGIGILVPVVAVSGALYLPVLLLLIRTPDRRVVTV